MLLRGFGLKYSGNLGRAGGRRRLGGGASRCQRLGHFTLGGGGPRVAALHRTGPAGLEGLHVGEQRRPVGISIGRLDRQQLIEDIDDPLVDLAFQLRQIGKAAGGELLERFLEIAPRHQAIASDHLVPDRPQREHVAPRIHRAAAERLGRQVAGRAHDGLAALAGLFGGDAGDAEIGEHRATASIDHDVAGLDVAVDDAFAGGGGQCVGGLFGDATSHFRRALALAIDELGQRFAVDVFHDEVGLAVVLVGNEDLGNVGMVERGDVAGLAQEAGHDDFVGAEFVAQALDGNETFELGIERLVDHAHAAAAELADDVIASENFAHVRHLPAGWVAEAGHRPPFRPNIPNLTMNPP